MGQESGNDGMVQVFFAGPEQMNNEKCSMPDAK
jgi:hypothetical protein